MKSRICFSLVAAGALLGTSVRGTTLDGIVEVVNDAPITELQVRDVMEGQAETIIKYIQDPVKQADELHKLQSSALESLVQNKLILGDFLSQPYMTNNLEEAVDKEIKKLIKDKFDGERSKLIKTLQEEGRSYEDFRKQEFESFIIDYAQYPYINPQQSHKFIISPLKIQTYYNEHPDEFKVDDQVKVRTITILQTQDGPPARAVADEVLQKIEGGASFAEMASVYSSDSGRANGGDRGWIEHNTLLPAITQAAFALKPGQHSQVVELNDDSGHPTGYCLVMVEENKPAHTLSLSEVQTTVERKLLNLKAKELLDKWLGRLRAKAHTTTF